MGNKIRERIREGKFTKICVKSFFNGALSRKYRIRRRAAMAAMSVILALGLAGIFINSQICYAVYMNGEMMGQCKTREEADAVVSAAEEQLTEILGYDYSLGGSISVGADLGTTASQKAEVENAIISNISAVREMYAMEVNGAIVGASENEGSLYGILRDIIAEYTTPDTTDIKFTGNITIKKEFVSADTVTDMSRLKELLEPSNKVSKCALTVESTEVAQHTEDVPFTTARQDDATMYVGDSKVITPGADGQTLVTESSAYIDGVLQSTRVVDSVVVQAPTAQVVAVGTAAKPRTASTGAYIWPTSGVITSGFGYRSLSGGEFHKGLDIAGSYGESIVAADGGVVVYAGVMSTYGNLVKIQHDNGDVTYYAHCSKILVSVGEHVYQGQEIAKMGATGNATGVHCHFEIRIGGTTPVNPLNYLPAK